MSLKLGSGRREHSGLDIFFSDDIRRVLLSIDEANWASAQLNNSRDAKISRQGFEAAIRAVATAFGITIRGPMVFEFFPKVIDRTDSVDIPSSLALPKR